MAGRPPSMPRWVKVSLLVVVALVAIILIALATGDHGPSRHGAGHVIESAALGAADHW